MLIKMTNYQRWRLQHYSRGRFIVILWDGWQEMILKRYNGTGSTWGWQLLKTLGSGCLGCWLTLCDNPAINQHQKPMFTGEKGEPRGRGQHKHSSSAGREECGAIILPFLWG